MRRDPPQPSIRIPDAEVAAGGCPALPSGEGGVRARAGWFLARLPGGWQG